MRHACSSKSRSLTGLGSTESSSRLRWTIPMKSPRLRSRPRISSHSAYHAGQIVYIAKSQRGTDWTNLSIPLGQSDKYNANPTRERSPLKS